MFSFSEDMEEDLGLSGLDERTVSLISGLSVLCVVLVIITLGIIGFFIKVIFINCQCIYIAKMSPNSWLLFPQNSTQTHFRRLKRGERQEKGSKVRHKRAQYLRSPLQNAHKVRFGWLVGLCKYFLIQFLPTPSNNLASILRTRAVVK